MRPSLLDDQSGIALIYVTIALPVIIAFALLAVDVGRFMTLQSSLQHGADSLALAGAAELDGSTNAITRANEAMQTFVTDNKALFSTSAATVKYADVTTCYLETIPSNDTQPISSSNCLPQVDNSGTVANELADASEKARFVQVIVTPKSYSTVFPVSFLGSLANNPSTTAEAVAGFQQAVCNFTPVFICNPLETTVTTASDDHGLLDYTKDWTKRRQSFKLISFATGSTATGVAGQFGFLDPATGKGKNQLGEEIAAVTPDLCYIQNKIDTKSGSMTDLANAFNTRFDLYPGSYGKGDYPPAQNVRKGYVFAKITGSASSPKFSTGDDACKPTQNTLAKLDTSAFLGMPVDSCFAAATPCKTGNGDWNYDPDIPATVSFTRYWNTNFGTSVPGKQTAAPVPTYAALGLDTSLLPAGTGLTGASTVTNAQPPPRYDVYKYENNTTIGTTLLRDYVTVPGTSSVYKSVPGESGKPLCATPTSVVDRRIIYAAVVNCQQQNLVPGNGNYTAAAFAKLFMIRPISTDNVLWVEFVDAVRPGDGSGVARDMVQLYR